MSEQTRQEVMDWLKARPARWVRLTRPGSALKVVGRNDGVGELDACSTDILEASLHLNVPGVEVALVFHEHVMGLQMLAYLPGTQRPVLSLPVALPYAEVHLEETTPPGEGGDDARSGEDEEFSPYALLFSGNE